MGLRIVSDAPAGSGCITPEQAERRGLLWVVFSFVLCPCHLPITLAILASLLSGTAAAVLLQRHPVITGVVITLIWAAGTWRGIRHMNAARAARERF